MYTKCVLDPCMKDGAQMRYLDDLRRAFADKEVTDTLLLAELEPEEVAELRRRYFPRWRPHREYPASESLRAFRKVLVEDTFEELVVLAIAPRDLDVKVELDDRVRIASPLRAAALQGL